jgi:DNA-directed RNA polymerase subunit beta
MVSTLPTHSGKSIEAKSFARNPSTQVVPNLIELQTNSFEWFKTGGLTELIKEVSPIEDVTGTRFRMHIISHEFGEPKNNEDVCRERELTFHAPLYLTVQLEVMETGERKEQKIFMGDIPMMTVKGTFIINGAERVVVSQLVRSPGVYFSVEKDAATEGNLASAKLIPYRGAWLEFETNSRGLITVKVDRKRKAAATTLLRAMGLVTDEEILGAFADVDDNPSINYIKNTLERGSTVLEREEVFRKDELRKLWTRMFNGTYLPEREFDEKGANALGSALLDLYRRLRPGEPANLENARTLVESLFYNPRRYDLGGVGRYKMNSKLGIDGDPDTRLLGKNDIVALVRYLIQLNNGVVRPDDIDHLGNRRVRAVGELIQNQMRVGFLRMERVIRERMTMAPEPEQATPNALINIRPVVAAVREFFGGSQLSQFMDQINPLAELTHKRRLSALGPGGLSRERAGFDVRDVHYSHYGRICPIETPEGPNIGLLGSLATFGKTNAFGFIETPYRLVVSALNNDDSNLLGRTITEPVSESGKVLLRKGKVLTKPDLAKLAVLTKRQVAVKPFVAASIDIGSVILETSDPRIEGAILAEDVIGTGSGVMSIQVGSSGTLHSVPLVKGTVITPIYARILRSVPNITIAVESVVYLSADQEDRHVIAQANTVLDGKGQFVDIAVESRSPATVSAGNEFSRKSPVEVAYMDVSPMQIVSVSTSLIPFLEHDDANRALMGSNMQRQAVPLLVPEAPLVGTGMEGRVAIDSGQVIISKVKGTATSVSGRTIVVTDTEGNQHPHGLINFARTNQGTCLTHRPIVYKGDFVEVGQPLADSSSTDQGNLALGQNVLVAFMSWEGYNFEDAIIISEALSKEDGFTSVHIERYEVDARDTKLGAEEITRDIPNVGEEGLGDLDEDGIIRIGAEVSPGDILVGKITPKGETELTAEEKLLRAIFGEKARDVRDTSLRVPHGERGKVIDVRVFNQRDDKEELAPGVNELVRVWVAQTRKITAGDKMAGRHGNKGVIARILPVEDMPYLPDGTPVDIILNPIGVPSRMNLGQVLETHLGWGAHQLGFRALTPVFDGARDEDIEDVLARAWFVSESGAVDRYSSSKNPAISIEVLDEWLRGYGYTAEGLFDTAAPGIAKAACLQIWLTQRGIDRYPETPAELEVLVTEISQEQGEVPPIYGKVKLTDGRTGEAFDQPITVGYIYMMKLVHLVEDKIHARSTGPYSLITQQPLGGKAQFGGQRFGEMEVWALEAYSGAYNLQEILTVKSDDVVGRVRTYEAIVKGDDVVHPGVPESFQVLLKELQSLGLAVELTTGSEELASPAAFPEGLDDDNAIDDFSDILGEEDSEGTFLDSEEDGVTSERIPNITI